MENLNDKISNWIKWQKLNKIMKEYISQDSFKLTYIKYLDLVKELSIKILEEKTNMPTSEGNLKSIPLNESITIIYNFLKTIDLNIANQFMNCIRATDEKGKPIINFIEGKGDSGLFTNGYVKIFYNNNIKDIFITFHEIMHKLNETTILINLNKFQTLTREYFTEAVSVIGENLLCEYMICNNLIKKEDLNEIIRDRLKDSQQCAEATIIYCELLDMKSRGFTLNKENINTWIEGYPEESIIYKVLKEELLQQKNINWIIQKEEISLPITQKYVIAQYLANQYKEDQQN